MGNKGDTFSLGNFSRTEGTNVRVKFASAVMLAEGTNATALISASYPGKLPGLPKYFRIASLAFGLDE